MSTESIRKKFCHQYSTANKIDYKIVAKTCKAIDKGLETDQMPSLMARPLVYTSIPFAYQSYQQAVKDMEAEIEKLKNQVNQMMVFKQDAIAWNLKNKELTKERDELRSKSQRLVDVIENPHSTKYAVQVGMACGMLGDYLNTLPK